MSVLVELSRKTQSSVWTHLLQGPVEQVAFLFAEVGLRRDGLVFLPRAVYLVPPCDFDIQSAFHVELSDEVRPRIIKQAWDTNTSIIELHSHPYDRRDAMFSPSDLDGFDEFVPHCWWRLRGRPYAAIVVSPKSVDALAWVTGPREPQQIDEIKVDGLPAIVPTGLTLKTVQTEKGAPNGS